MSQSNKSKNLSLSQTKYSTSKQKSGNRLEQKDKVAEKRKDMFLQRKKVDDYNISNRENFPEDQRRR